MSATNELNWNNLRALGGSQQNGFEELCCQLADAERPTGSSFVRKGRPDAGVECYAVLPDGREWAWQAKFFDSLDDAQWRQLDDSVRTALEKHPHLARYFVCVPIDLADPRTSGRRSARDRWNEHVAKWSGWARDRGVEVEFIYWGAYELVSRLSRPEHAGRVRFWFDAHRFDETWFASRLEEALGAAGPRYTPEIHVTVPVAAKLETFGRTPRFVDALKSHGRRIRNKLERFEYAARNALAAKQNGQDDGPAEMGPSPLGDVAAEVSAAAGHVLSGLAALAPQPVGALPLSQLAEEAGAAAAAADAASRSSFELEEPPRAAEAPGKLPTTGRNRQPAYERVRSALYELEIALAEAREGFEEADVLASADVLILTGKAGTGKTHLLCDVARRRLAEGRPTVLLMGQRFLNQATPWIQAAEMLDLAGTSAEEFVGALEAAAQASGTRALVIIDALNEGTGRTLWPAHLAAFLIQLLRSEWIRVVLAVRESYEARVIPDTIRAGAARIEHSGFDGREYDATRTFFAHYGIERPSAPLLPEFRNPLFLKVLCRGLRDGGQRRMPRGFHGITAVFDLFLRALNRRLSGEFGYNERHPLVKNACLALASAFVDEGRPWLRLERAEELVNALLPGRDFERSLYHALVAEGVLVEEGSGPGGTDEQVVIIAYERLADHLIASGLIDRHVDPENPEKAFEEAGPLGWLAASDRPPQGYVTTGLLEAFCVQLPERTSKELAECCPGAARRWRFADAFRQSLVWRAPGAFSGATLDLFERVTESAEDERDAADVLLTLASIPGHPWNAAFLHEWLRHESMPTRDAWWSIALHRLWSTRSAARRLVDWAWSQSSSSDLEDEVVDLGATALAWMLTTPNRFARDQATKALVTLLTGRIPAVVQLLERFADVDDPYVSERLFAVTYGCAMRSSDAAEVGVLARTVYARVFAGGEPPRHILLRDYARGVLERAEHLGVEVPIAGGPFRPPYRSPWPAIPTEDDIAALKPEWSRISHDSGDPGWGMGRIWSSVMDDDFARYVIGTNSHSTNWLNLRLDEPEWQTLDEQLSALVGTFDMDERAAWIGVERAAGALAEVEHAVLLEEARADETDGIEGEQAPEVTAKLVEDQLERLGEPRRELERAIERLSAAVTGDKAASLAGLLAEKRDAPFRDAPRLDLGLIQRYVLARVFELGWTTERFGSFDRYDIGYHGRDATKAERMGKKYQWIALHEILASMSDHYQYRERFREDDGDRAYEGPWQDGLRDIDPSCISKGPPADVEEETGATSWWTVPFRAEWLAAGDHDEWAVRPDDLPEVPELLAITRADDGSAWLNLDGLFAWKQAAPPDRDPHGVDRREIVFIWHGYFVRSGDSAAFVEWAETVNFWDRVLPDPPSRYYLSLGEHAWSPAARYFDHPYYGSTGWVAPSDNRPVEVRVAAVDYVHERAGFDCSADESFTLRLPADEFVRSARLRWNGIDAEFLGPDGDLFAFDPAASAPGPNALLVAGNASRRYLADNGLELCWAVKGMKEVIAAGYGMERHARLYSTGAYRLTRDSLSGFLTCRPSRRDGATTAAVTIRRSLSIT